MPLVIEVNLSDNGPSGTYKHIELPPLEKRAKVQRNLNDKNREVKKEMQPSKKSTREMILKVSVPGAIDLPCAQNDSKSMFSKQKVSPTEFESQMKTRWGKDNSNTGVELKGRNKIMQKIHQEERDIHSRLEYQQKTRHILNYYLYRDTSKLVQSNSMPNVRRVGGSVTGPTRCRRQPSIPSRRHKGDGQYPVLVVQSIGNATNGNNGNTFRSRYVGVSQGLRPRPSTICAQRSIKQKVNKTRTNGKSYYFVEIHKPIFPSPRSNDVVSRLY